MRSRQRAVCVTLGALLAIGVPTGCGKIASRAAAETAEALARQASSRLPRLQRMVEELDDAGARRIAADIEALSVRADTAAQRQGTAAARRAAEHARTVRRQADAARQTGWTARVHTFAEKRAQAVVLKQLRRAFWRAACDQVEQSLRGEPAPEVDISAARVALHANGLADVEALRELVAATKQDLEFLRGLDPANPADRDVLVYVSTQLLCRTAVDSLQPARTGYGYVLHPQPVTVVDAYGRAVGMLAPSDIVAIVCTTIGDAVTGPYGTTSALWDFVGTGYVPDAYLYTGTNDPVAPPCR